MQRSKTQPVNLKRLKSKSVSLDPDIKNKERYVQKDELDEEWMLEIPTYDREDYAAVNRQLLNGELLLNVPGTTMIFRFITRVLQTVVNDLNQMVVNGKNMPFR